ncbi:MAG: DNA polymerase domain-containing protein, partial [Thermoplasmata archaeon]
MAGSPAASGWLLDVDERPDGRGVRVWIRRPDGSTTVTAVEFASPFYVEVPADERADLMRRLADDGRAASVEPVVRRLRLDDRRPVRSLAITPRRVPDRFPLARSIDALGGYSRYRLYNVDRPVASEFYRARRLYPFAPLTGPAEAPVALEPAGRIDYRPMPLRVAELAITVGDRPREAAVPDDAPIREIRFGGERMDGPEEPLLGALVERLAREDPDLLVTDGGDRFDVPRLYARARAHGLGAERFHLGRIPGGERPFRGARSFASYGRIYHRPAAYRAPGRFHVDRATSFLYDDVGLAGLVDAARLSRLPFETVARQSPGTVFTALEVETALDAGAAVPWKKNRPEGFRTGDHLVRADRGGVIFQPPVGIHDAVDEFDFVSLFPHLMVRHNLSPESLGCRCCPASPHVAPGLGYRFCARRPGLLARTLAPLIARRRALRRSARRSDRSPEARSRDRERAKMLKWILVTAFGYQGYRNAP